MYFSYVLLIKEFLVDKLESLMSQKCTDFLPFYQKPSKAESFLYCGLASFEVEYV